MSQSLLSILFLATVMLLSMSADAQPTRRDTMMRTPKFDGLAGTRPKVKKPPKKAPGATGAAAKEASSGTEAGGGINPEDPFANINSRREIGFKPLSPYQKTNFNLDDANLADLVKAISNITGRRFIFGGKLRTDIKATVVSPQKVTVAEAYGAFLSILEINGLTVLPHGRYLKIVQTSGIASKTTPVLGTATPVPYADRYVTRMYRLAHASAQEVSTVLGKFKSKDGDITIYQPTNMLIITDTGSNIRRMLRIIEELDSGGVGEQIWMHPIHYAAASEIASQLGEMLDIGSSEGRAKIMAEERNNLLIIVATESDYLRILEIVKRLDVSSAVRAASTCSPCNTRAARSCRKRCRRSSAAVAVSVRVLRAPVAARAAAAATRAKRDAAVSAPPRAAVDRLIRYSTAKSASPATRRRTPCSPPRPCATTRACATSSTSSTSRGDRCSSKR
jgi:general secretion pathway protein D